MPVPPVSKLIVIGPLLLLDAEISILPSLTLVFASLDVVESLTLLILSASALEPNLPTTRVTLLLVHSIVLVSLIDNLIETVPVSRIGALQALLLPLLLATGVQNNPLRLTAVTGKLLPSPVHLYHPKNATAAPRPPPKSYTPLGRNCNART